MSTYLISFGIQEKEIGVHCFDNCGAIIFGRTVNVSDGAFMYCHRDDCPYLEKQMDESCGTIDGQECYIRKLKEVSK